MEVMKYLDDRHDNFISVKRQIYDVFLAGIMPMIMTFLVVANRI